MSHSNEQKNQASEEQVLTDEALESVAGGAPAGGIGGGIGPIMPTIAFPTPVPLPIAGPVPVNTTTA